MTPWLRRTRWTRVQGLPTCCSIFGQLIWPVSFHLATTAHHRPPTRQDVHCRRSATVPIVTYGADQLLVTQAGPVADAQIGGYCVGMDRTGITPWRVVTGDITRCDVDVIVNAANSSLLGGGGVDGAIHRAAGPDLVQECRLLGGCKTGQAKMTKGYRLVARNIIHTVGPVWKGGEFGEDQLLASCYAAALCLAEKHHLRSIAFPAISTGIYRYPLAAAAAVASQAVARYLLEKPGTFTCILFVCFDDKAHEAYSNAVATQIAQMVT